jgi:hypothetical protein
MVVQRLLKTYDPKALRWANRDDRHAIVREILVRGDAVARQWLRRKLPWGDPRADRRVGAAGSTSRPVKSCAKDSISASGDLPCAPTLGTILWLKEVSTWAENPIVSLTERSRSSAHEKRISVASSKERCRERTSALRTPFLTSACRFVSSTSGDLSAARDR